MGRGLRTGVVRVSGASGLEFCQDWSSEGVGAEGLEFLRGRRASGLEF